MARGREREESATGTTRARGSTDYYSGRGWDDGVGGMDSRGNSAREHWGQGTGGPSSEQQATHTQKTSQEYEPAGDGGLKS